MTYPKLCLPLTWLPLLSVSSLFACLSVYLPVCLSVFLSVCESECYSPLSPPDPSWLILHGTSSSSTTQPCRRQEAMLIHPPLLLSIVSSSPPSPPFPCPLSSAPPPPHVITSPLSFSPSSTLMLYFLDVHVSFYPLSISLSFLPPSIFPVRPLRLESIVHTDTHRAARVPGSRRAQETVLTPRS